MGSSNLNSAVAPWDRLTEAVGAKFADIEKVKPDAVTKTVVNASRDYFAANPTETAFFIRDPKQVLVLWKRDEIAKELESVLSGDGYENYGTFGFDNSDYEIYADGSGPFGGEWDYAVTQALDNGQNKALKKMPPKVKLEPVQGKTSLGWRVTIAHPYQTYLNAGIKAAETEAASMVLKGVYPKGEQSPYSHAPKELRAKYMKKGPKTVLSNQQESRKPNEAIQRLSDSRATDMVRLKKLAGI